jgi:hypothetical protein
MKHYRLKKEAVPFFKEECATKILSMEQWKQYQVEEKALEEVEDAIVYFGFQHETYSSLCGWSSADRKDSGANFHFTIRFPSVKYEEYDKFSNGKITRELMDRVQRNVSQFFNDYKNDKLSNQN